MVNNSVKDEIQKYWGKRASGFDADIGHGIHTDLERDEWIKFLNNVIGTKPLEVLNLGCGTGEMARMLYLAGHRVVAVDFTPEMLELIKQKTFENKMNITILEGDAEDPPVKKDSFDVIYSRHLVWTLPNPKKAFKNWYKILRNGGSVIIVDGSWLQNGLITKVLSKISKIIKNIFYKSDSKKEGLKEYQHILPKLNYPNGMSQSKIKSILLTFGFSKVEFYDINNIIKVQKKHAPLWFKIQNRKAEKWVVKAIK